MPTRLGPHNLAPNTAGKILFDAGSRFVVQVDNFDASYAAYPGAVIIGRRVSTYPADPSRVVTAENLYQAHATDPEGAAEIFVNIQRLTYDANQFIKIWCGPNEPAFTDDVNAMQWYGLFENHRVELLAALGLRAAVGCFSYGTPDIRDGFMGGWSAFLPALHSANSNNGFLALHEYNRNLLVSSPDQNGNPLPLDANGEGWWSFRYRKVRRLVLAPNGLADLTIALTEFARGIGVGYKAMGLSDAEAAADLIEADKELRKDPNVYAAIFTCGTNSHAWDTFNIDGTQVPNLLAAYIRNLPTTDPPPNPPPDTGGEGDNQMPIVLLKEDWTRGTYKFPGTDNLNIPIDFEFKFLHDTPEPSVPYPNVDPHANYLQPEGKLRRSQLDAQYFSIAEVLPDAEVPLYLDRANGIPLVLHLFWLFGKMWWWLTRTITAPAGNYTFRVKLYSDIYTGSHVFDNNPQSGEWRLNIDGQPDLDFSNITSLHTADPRGERWRQLSRTFDHPGGPIRHTLEAREVYGVEHVGFFVEEWEIIQNSVSGTTNPPPTNGGTGDATGSLASKVNRLGALLAQLGPDSPLWVEARQLMTDIKAELK